MFKHKIGNIRIISPKLYEFLKQKYKKSYKLYTSSLIATGSTSSLVISVPKHKDRIFVRNIETDAYSNYYKQLKLITELYNKPTMFDKTAKDQ